MFVEKGKDYMKTLLERAKGSLLEISIDQNVPVSTMALLSPHSQRIRSLEFKRDYWEGIRKFSEASPGPFPLLRTLRVMWFHTCEDAWATPPSSPFFANAPNVEKFTYRSTRFQFLRHFVLPNLTTFSLWTPEVARSGASNLFDFLKASPMLRTVRIRTPAGIMLEDIPQQTVIILPNVETFSLTSDGKNVYDVALHISCPHAKVVSLRCQVSDLDMLPSWEIFPTSARWNAIVHQYTKSPVEEVTLEIPSPFKTSSLAFQSADTSTLSLFFEIVQIIDDTYESDIDLGELVFEAFSQGFKTIQAHPLLPSVKRLRIECRDLGLHGFQILPPVTEIERVFERVGLLDELIINSCNLRPYLAGFAKLDNSEKPIVFPPIKQLTISNPSMETDEEEYMGAITELAKSQHARGIPFERVAVRAKRLPVAMAERLRQWVSAVDCYEDSPVEEG